MTIRIISAISSNGLIGINGQLAVKNKLDMQKFKEKTSTRNNPSRQNIVIMGRKTFESMGSKPLPNRKNAVISSTKIDVENVSTYSSIKEAIAHNSYLMSNSPDIWLIGGSGIYDEGMEYAKEIHLTVSKTKVEFTKEDIIARFPVINPMIWGNPTMNEFYIPGYDHEFSRTDEDIKLYTYKRLNA